MSVLPFNFGMCRCMCGFLFGTILFCSLGITLLELASDLELPKGGQAWHQLRNGELPNIFTQGLFIH